MDINEVVEEKDWLKSVIEEAEKRKPKFSYETYDSILDGIFESEFEDVQQTIEEIKAYASR